jgi:hypothetical protein
MWLSKIPLKQLPAIAKSGNIGALSFSSWFNKYRTIYFFTASLAYKVPSLLNDNREVEFI